ncbi:hypothetical protein WJU16_01275 [Chitinophaga pollutisoli]|uniref:Uncharacterized protein n=1 Tax=Chitinophaga pollutisoli TaxID=3133966 RepID=A0ABZ2YPJ1_9BACT
MNRKAIVKLDQLYHPECIKMGSPGCRRLHAGWKNFETGANNVKQVMEANFRQLTDKAFEKDGQDVVSDLKSLKKILEEQ